MRRLAPRRSLFAGRYKDALAKRAAEGTLRSTTVRTETLVDFASNDYLGVARDAAFAAAHFAAEAKRADAAAGSTGSRLLTGASREHDAFEAFAAAFHERESALLFGSGYAANSAVAATLPLPSDAVLFDERSHNSTRFGLKRSRASLQIPFAHNDLDDLRVKLRDHEGVLIFVEGIYSMDGDEAPLQELAELCLEDGRAGLIVDEAHSTGILGDCGRGAVATLPPQLRRAVVAQVHTFGKALGGHGAVVVCDATTREYLANYAQPFVYATAPPDSHSRLARRAYEAVAAADDARRHLARLIDLFRAECDVGSLLLPSRTPIQAVLAPGADVVSRAADRVRRAGFDVCAIRAPTVPAGAERLRLVLHAFNTEDEVLGVARAVREAVDASSSSSSEERLVG